MVGSKEVARPLPVLAELIQHNIDKMAEVSDKATLPYRIAAGYLLAEARTHSWDHYYEWVKRFGKATRTARTWIAEAKQDAKEAGKEWKWADAPPPSTTPDAIRRAKWRGKNKEKAKVSGARDAAAARGRSVTDRDEEFAREHAKAKALQKMCDEMIVAGYRALSEKYHPDKGHKDDSKFKLLGEAKSYLKKMAYPKKLSEFRS